MRRIDRYILLEGLLPATVGGLLVLMLLVGNKLYVLLKWLYAGSPAGDIGKILLFSLPTVLMLALPASLLLGTALGLNRLERDRELMAMRMTGTRLTRLILPLLVMAVFASGLLFLLQEKIIPQCEHQAQKLTRKLTWGSPTALIPRDVMLRVGQNYVYVREVDQKAQTLHGVMVCKVDAGTLTWLTIPVAENHNGQWYFKRDPVTQEKPKVYIFAEHGNPIYGEIEGKDNWLNLKQDVTDFLGDEKTNADEFSFNELRALQDGVRGVGMPSSLPLEPNLLTFELNHKIAAPLAALVAVLIAIPLSIHFGRSGGYVGLLLSVVVAFFFVISQQWGQVLVEQRLISPILGAWAPDALFGGLGIVLLLLEE